MAKNQRRMEVQKRKKLFKKMIGLFLLLALMAMVTLSEVGKLFGK